MIGVKFLFRVLEFLAAAGIISLIIVVVWFWLSRLFRWVWDGIEKSNGEFATWLKGKFRRDNDLMPFLCRRGLHKWSKWKIDYAGVNTKTCLRCGQTEKK